MRVLPTLAILTAGLGPTGCATNPIRPLAAISPVMAVGDRVEAPAGFIALCKREPASCVAHHASVGMPQVGASEMLPLLRKVNKMVNGGVRQMRDEAVFGVPEYWHRSGVGFGASGDCEDLAIEKRERLLAAGIPADRLYYAIAYRRGIGLHAVLIAATPKGEIVLDSRTPYLHLWNDVPYAWVSRQSASDPLQWSMVVDQPASRRAPAMQLASVIGTDTAAVGTRRRDQ